ncbi:hypothetical protein FHT85_005330 [Rhizobium sp. BK312]|uniref:P-loop NTPase fold protein n=1 Tax=Rhizobium sp. BK312 TaxID=2587080 RepID=UPI0013AFA03A|nr:P-loop NTPase fold protein [Rhizobium sp. BK312]MBB3428305.1 hypothetical protein [Rhizobium sp. BK312]
MSVPLVQEAIAQFLNRKDPEVLCIRGRWGVGKTYTWSKALESAHDSGTVKLARYSYVSLFGINSLDELKLAVFENVIAFSQGLKRADLETLDAYVSSIGSWRKLAKLAQSIPIVKNFAGGEIGGLVSFMTIRDQIICIDDLERRGQKLDVGDVLGLISFLREQRNCKIVLLLNDEQLSEEARKDFERNLEKVADTSLVFEPSTNDSVKVGISGETETDGIVTDCCVSLGITNIRVIKRIRRLVAALEPLLAEFDADVFKTAARSVVLFGWSRDQAGLAPPLSFLRRMTVDLSGGRRNDIPADEAAWNSLLAAYGYVWTDELDQALIVGVERGFFDADTLKGAAKIAHDKIVATKADGAFEAAWSAYHDSFSNDDKDVLDGIYMSFMKNVRYISPVNLSGTVSLFKELGRPEQAKDMIEHYMAERKEPRSYFDLDEYPFAESITDNDVRDAFEARVAEIPESRDVAGALLSIKSGWSEGTLTLLATTDAKEYAEVLKAHSGSELRRMLSNALQFDRISNATDQMKEIPKRVRAALMIIGQESPINARRVRRFGVSVPAANEAKANGTGET